MAAQRLAGVIRRHDGKLFPVYGVDHQDGDAHLHVQGAVVDFWATPGELYRRGWSLVMATRPVWDVWGMGVGPSLPCVAGRQEVMA
ncbi:hypothetical protein AB4090_08265 [Acidithiobacillus sp. IBUN Pt1247-S3]|uniref:hypothetical protein n=1 Tax=Acidithiobacillus sp. IBUN Pt1247-S3 TaxID=3166642 RepID=UPI0034E3E718